MHPVAANRGFGLAVETEPRSGCCVGARHGVNQFGRGFDASVRAPISLDLEQKRCDFRQWLGLGEVHLHG